MGVDDDRSFLSFRVATRADVGTIVALVHSAYRGDASRVGWTTEAELLEGQRTDERLVAEMLDVPGSLVLLAFAHGSLLACCHLSRRDATTAHFGLFAVRPTEQGAGHGRAVLEEAEHLASASLGATVLEMDVLRQREELIAWYRRRGFEPTGERAPFPYGDASFGRPLRDDLEFIVLAKQLA